MRYEEINVKKSICYNIAGINFINSNSCFNHKYIAFTLMPLQDYEQLNKLNHGKYATVYKVRRIQDQQLFALKKVPLLQMETRAKKNALTEVKLLQSYKHPNIIGLIQVCYDSEQGHLCLILEYSERGDLATEIRRRAIKKQPFKEDELWMLLYQASKGLVFLHEQNILHRDLKPSNILLFPDGVAKIADLNVSTSFQNLNYTRTGTLTYASPQIWKGEVYDSKCDIWSLGCLIYEMATLRVPFQAENMEKLYKNIIKCNYEKINETYSRQFRDLVSFMIQINSKLRPTAKTISKMCMSHCGSEREKSRLYSVTPQIESKFRLKPIEINMGESQYSLSRAFKKQNTKRLVIRSQKLRSSSPKSVFDLEYQFEKQLKSTEQIRDYICNRLMKNNADNAAEDNIGVSNLNRSNLYKRTLKHPKKQERVLQSRQRRHTQI